MVAQIHQRNVDAVKSMLASAAARPIAPHLRDEFLQAVAVALAGQREIGPGVVFRVLRDTQRRFFDPPVDTTSTIRHGGYGL
jgi:hypothetical protein